MADHTHKIQIPRDPEQTMLSRTCQRCGEKILVSIPSTTSGSPPGGR